jgi:ubiquinone/menaquinone biosynthesis C-methylase UbiE
MTLLLPETGGDYEEWTRVLAPEAAECSAKLLREVDAQGWKGRETAREALLRYLEYFRWPARQMEYSFVLRALARICAARTIASILDVGSGPSAFPLLLASKLAARVTAVDSEREIMEAFAGLRLPGCSYAVSDMRRLPFHDRSVDAVTCVSVLEHVPRAEGLRAVSEMLRVVREDGVVVLTVDYRSLDPGGALVKQLGRAGKAIRLLLTGKASTLVRSASAPGPYSWADLQELGRRFPGPSVGEPDPAWARLSLGRVTGFWRDHWEPGFHYSQEAGRDYTSVGLVLSPDPAIDGSLRDVGPGRS